MPRKRMRSATATRRRRDATGPAGGTPALHVFAARIAPENMQSAKRSAGVLAGWPGGVPPPPRGGRAARATHEWSAGVQASRLRAGQALSLPLDDARRLAPYFNFGNFTWSSNTAANRSPSLARRLGMVRMVNLLGSSFLVISLQRSGAETGAPSMARGE
jgi:hypothetical protein